MNIQQTSEQPHVPELKPVRFYLVAKMPFDRFAGNRQTFESSARSGMMVLKECPLSLTQSHRSSGDTMREFTPSQKTNEVGYSQSQRQGGRPGFRCLPGRSGASPSHLHNDTRLHGKDGEPALEFRLPGLMGWALQISRALPLTPKSLTSRSENKGLFRAWAKRGKRNFPTDVSGFG